MAKQKFKYQFFLSSSSQDRQYVQGIHGALKGYKVFHSEIDLKDSAGEAYFDVISQAIIQSKDFILVVSPESMKSKWVQIEYQTFFNNCYAKDKRRIFLVKGEGYKAKDVPVLFRNFQMADTIDQILSICGESESKTPSEPVINAIQEKQDKIPVTKKGFKPLRLIIPVGALLLIAIVAIYFISSKTNSSTNSKEVKKSDTLSTVISQPVSNEILSKPATDTASVLVKKDAEQTVNPKVLVESLVPVPISTTVFPNGDKFEGQMKDGKMHGNGTYHYSSRQLISEYDTSERYADAGDFLVGVWNKGELYYGTLYSKDSIVKNNITIGKID